MAGWGKMLAEEVDPRPNICRHCGELIQTGGSWNGMRWTRWEHVNSRTITCLAGGKLSSTEAEPAEPASENTCKNCRQPVTVWSPSMDGNHAWRHLDGGVWLCIVDGVRTGKHAELAVDDAN